ncbi:MAG: hypothetical protein ACJA0C_000915 [Candidatus Endobugula sp.]|jgi:hypothetical protein
MNKIFYVLLIIILSSCSWFGDEYILDLSTSTRFILQSNGSEFPSGYTLRAEGYSTADGVIELMLNDTVYKAERVTGEVDFKWSGDWYSQDMKLVYRLQKSGKGTLKITYKID